MIEEGSPDHPLAQDSTAYDDMIGQTIASNFRIVKRIGSGAMGRVYEAEQLSLGKMVAIKILRRELMADEKLLVRFQFEARAASAVNHPNLVQIFDCGRDPNLDVAYIAMELLPGNDLSQVLQREWPLPLQRSARIIDQVLAALDEAHSQGIVHRDLKPGNIMLVARRNEQDFVKVCDFGIAKAETNRQRPKLTMTGLVFGTPEYMSPEQARGADVDGRTDLYAVATILYQLVAGEVPFPAPSPTEVLARLLREAPERPSAAANIQIPEPLERLIMQGLSKRAEDRPQTAALFREQLRDSLVGVVDHWPGQSGNVPAQTSPSIVPGVTGAGTSIPRSRTPSPLNPHPDTTRTAVPVEASGGKSRKGLWALVVLSLVGGGAFAATQTGIFTKQRSERAGTETVPTEAKPIVGEGAAPPPSPPAATTDRSATIEQLPSEPAAKAAVGENGAGNELAAADPSADVATVGGKPAAGAVRAAVPPRGRPEKAGKRIAAAERSNGRAHDSGGGSAAVATATTPAAAPTAEEAATPPAAASNAVPVSPVGPAEVMKEAERLLGQGEVATACRKGEEVRRMSPKSPVVYKFLGKCYMRAGKPQPASDAYRRYLELAPDAPDAAFIKSYVK